MRNDHDPPSDWVTEFVMVTPQRDQIEAVLP
jgi:hypothetical protein